MSFTPSRTLKSRQTRALKVLSKCVCVRARATTVVATVSQSDAAAVLCHGRDLSGLSCIPPAGLDATMVTLIHL